MSWVPDHALELSFTETSASVVTRAWDALLTAVLPSQAEHKSMTNAPHLTLVAAAPIESSVLRLARTTVLPLLPCELPVVGLVVFGTGARVTLAYLIEPPPALVAGVADLRAAVPSVRHPVWTPHVTLARRVPRASLSEAVAALPAMPESLGADRLRWWDPTQNLIETLGG